jgi:CheY-like chemotaxis protein
VEVRGFPPWPERAIGATIFSMRVLIVDDNEAMRRTIRDVLEDLSPVVAECADGDEVLARFEAFDPDWVLMDLRMERVDGLTATAALRAAHPEARVVVVSAHDQDDLRRAAQRAGAHAYVAKNDLLELRRILA